MQKTIYIKDSDSEIFEKAEEILGTTSLSEAIAKALRKTIEYKKAAEQGWQEYELDGAWCPDGFLHEEYRKIKFAGRKLAGYQEVRNDNDAGIWNIYQRRGGKIIVSAESPQDESKFNRINALYKSLDEIDGQTVPLAGLRHMIPKRIIIEAREALGEYAAVYID